MSDTRIIPASKRRKHPTQTQAADAEQLKLAAAIDALAPGAVVAFRDITPKPPKRPRWAKPPLWEKRPKPPAAATSFPKLRALSSLCAFLAEETPERAALLKAARIDAADIVPSNCRSLAKGIMRGVEEPENADARFAKLPTPSGEQASTDDGLVTRRLSHVFPRDVDWVWEGRVPAGNLTLICGDPDLGKSWVVLDMIARITTGRPFPDGEKPPTRQSALWVSAEDSDEDTIRPRFDILEGDASRFFSLAMVRDEGKEASLNLSRHLDLLDDWLKWHPLVRVVALDPFTAFLGGIDSHRNTDVRGLLSPLKKLAEKHQVAVIGINHLNKGDGANALYRSSGSIAFVAAARSAWLVTADSDEPKDRRLFTKIKSNLAATDPPGLAFRIGPHVGGILWEEGTVETTANEALRPPVATRAPAREEAKNWLAAFLKDGPVDAGEILAAAKAEGLNEKTLRTAKRELGIERERIPGSKWGAWKLPTTSAP